LLLVTAIPAAADAQCKPATGPQSKCVKDAQCCAGLVCQGKRCQSGCRIGGTFYAGGALNPANACQSCDPAVSTTTFTNRASGTACNDGNVCTYNDICNGSGVCVGTSITCTSDTCNTRTCNGTSSCTVTSNTGASCNDGNACTYSDTCNGSGVCVGTSITCTSDTCNTHTCNGTSSCTVTPNTGTSCNDGNACTYDDACNGSGVCVGIAILCASDTCSTRTCNGTSTCTVTPEPDGTTCNDGNACTVTDTCQSGICGGSNVPDGTTCDDGNTGTKVDVCTAGTCGACVPAGECTAPPCDDCIAFACAFNEDCPAGETCDFATVPSPRFVDNGDTVTDRKTCLVWEKKNEADAGQDFTNPHDADNTYQWSSTGTAMDGGAFTDFLVELNAGTGFAGHTDWRLPTSGGCCGSPTGQPAELESIVDTSAAGCGTGSPCINATFGPTVASLYWSSSTDAISPYGAWVVNFSNGGVGSGVSKTDGRFVRAVRGGP
jgi:hypothetical protein